MPTPPFLPGTVYHVYNRGVSRQTVFVTDAHYRRFLALLAHHAVPCLHVYAFALLPNHFHLVAAPRENAPRPASQGLSNACNAYAQHFNRRMGRTGTLFCRPFQRKAVTDARYLAALVRYVHGNAHHHGLVGAGQAWAYTSEALLCSDRPTRLEREAVRVWLGVGDTLTGLETLTGLAALVDELADPLFEGDPPRGSGLPLSGAETPETLTG